jgi:twitching motility protein PilT
MVKLNKLVELVIAEKASDLHLRVGSSPIIRVDGKLMVRTELAAVTTADMQNVLEAVATHEQMATFAGRKELDLAYSYDGGYRFRINVMMQRGTPSIAFRTIPVKIPTIDELGLPQVLKQLILKPRGLVLVTGPTGTGKSTTMAAMLDFLNDNESRNVVTIEEPIEFMHQNKKSIIVQREVGNDTASFAMALTRALRHDPDVIVVGEMRDLPTIATAITAAETGHLVLATLHTYNAAQSVDRVIDVFPPDQQDQVRFQLAQVIEAVLSQTLMNRLDGGRVAAFEIMVATSGTRNLIRDNKTHQLPTLIETGSQDGMRTLDQDLADLVKRNVIALEDALLKVHDLKGFEQWLKSPVSK